MDHYSVTLILILHNRHQNLDRQLDYYRDFSSPIIIADSSKQKHQLNSNNALVQHIYTPEKTFTQKIEFVLQQVHTPYVVMCADDDFIIPESLYSCTRFLDEHKQYSIAQGTCIRFYKSSVGQRQTQFDLLYEVKSYDIEMDDPFVRLEQMFKNYRSVLYAVHRTDVLRLAFRNSGAVVKNLFLNEYLTAIVPIICGKYKELPVLYQVREYAEGSDDKLTDNLDIIYQDKRYEKELRAFIDLQVNNVSSVLSVKEQLIRNEIEKVLEEFSGSPLIGNRVQPVSLKKKLGNLIKLIPFLGGWLIQKNRQKERQKNLQKVLRSASDVQHIAEIDRILKKHA